MISICIPAYNAAQFLSKTLGTIQAQTFSEWELIVVEDGSDDGTRLLVEKFAQMVSQSVRYFRHAENQGLTATRNTGIAAAEREWIAILDADDLWEPEHLARCVETLSERDCSLIHGGSVLFDSDSGCVLEERAPSAAALGDSPVSVFTQDYIIQPSSVVLRKSLWEQVGGFNTGFQHVEDLEMWLRCLRAGARIGYSGHLTCRYRKHAAAMSGESYAMAAAFARVYAQHLDWEAIPWRLRKERAYHSAMAAGRLAWRKNPKRARGHFHEAWKISRKPVALAAALSCAGVSLCRH
ncbi:MAG: glycosyltransferase [Verrucomicrobia bacterium]|jgi:glycosyltransferase involved in cell wall biosynthesis|nr:glycosyltransferase [Verrucomicrobiota bacterium]